MSMLLSLAFVAVLVPVLVEDHVVAAAAPSTVCICTCAHTCGYVHGFIERHTYKYPYIF